jgi:hypothetical protein
MKYYDVKKNWKKIPKTSRAEIGKVSLKTGHGGGSNNFSK